MAAMEKGGTYISSLSVVNVAGAPTDAATAVLTITLPDQTTVTPVVTHSGVGAYNVTYTLAQAGLYRFVWTTTSPATTKSDFINVTEFRSVVGLDDVKQYINFNPTSNEGLLRQMMMSVTELIEEVVGTCVPITFTNKFVTGSQAIVLRLPRGPILSETSVTSISSVYTPQTQWTQAKGDFIVNPEAGTVRLQNYFPFYYGPWHATYTAGRTVISQKIQLAALETLYDLWATQRPYGADALEPGPHETAVWEGLVNIYKIPPHAMAMLAGEERPGFR